MPTPKEIETFKKGISKKLPHLQKADPVLIVWADLHFSLKPPLAREDEKDWLAKQAEYVDEVKLLRKALDVEIACAGDVFDKWNASAKLCNYLIDILPTMYAVPGQHDLPYHSYDLIEDSGFANLVKAGKIEYLPVGVPINCFMKGKSILIQGFGWENELAPIDKKEYSKNPDTIAIAIVHKYFHMGPDTCYPGAKGFVRDHNKQLAGFDIVISGDNHTPFGWCDSPSKTPYFFNCGSFMRRKANEVLTPSVGIVFSDGSVHRYFLESSNNDAINHTVKDNNIGVDPDAVFNNPELIQAILNESNSDKPIKFTDAIRQHLMNGNIGKHIRQIVLEALEDKK